MTRFTLTRRLLTAALGAAAVVAVAAPATAAPPVAGPSAPAPNPAAAKPGQPAASPVSARDAALIKRQDALLPAAKNLAGQARAAGSDISGVRIDVPAGVIHVYRTDPAQPLRLPAGALPAGTQVVVHQAKFSRGAMLQAADRVTRDARVLGEQKVSVQAVGPSVDGSGISVGIFVRDTRADVDLSRASTLLRSRYGAVVGQVTGVRRQTSDRDLFFAGWRFNDFAPWYGGDRISSSAGGCTTGFAANYNGAPAMLTAAHCGGVGTAFYNGPRTNGTFSYMGSSVYSDSSTDIGAISVSSYSLYINVGPAENSGLLYVGAWASPVVGQYLCQSGSYTGEVCGLYVVDTGQQVCVSWFLWWCTGWQGPLADVINSAGSGSYAAGHGDSGGPVYLRNGSSGTAMGLVHGQLTPNAQAAYPAYFPDTMWCPAPEGWSQRCSSGFSFAHMPGY